MNFSKVQFGKNSGLRGDRCNDRDCKEFESLSGSPLKYYTTNYFKDGVENDAGINFSEGFGISQGFIDKETSLSRGMITNPRVRQDLGTLPLASIEGLATSSPIISAVGQRELKSCQPRDDQFQDRRFWSFGENPNAVQKDFNFRQGSDTRNDTRTSYNKK